MQSIICHSKARSLSGSTHPLPLGSPSSCASSPSPGATAAAPKPEAAAPPSPSSGGGLSLNTVAAVLGRSGTIVLLQPNVSGGDWITIDVGVEHGGFQDMAFSRARLCALGHDGVILAYWANLSARVAAVSELQATQHPGGGSCRLYLVECEGELVVVRKLYNVRRDSVEVEVEVCRFRPEECKWEAVKELPGQTLVVGSVASVEAAGGVRENCVYFARRDVEMMVSHAIGVYSLGDGETTAVAIAGGHSVDVEPVWISASVV